jgi:hypothetical protein
MVKMPKLKKLYSDVSRDQFVIIGVNFDQDSKRTEKAIAENKLTWPMVRVPADDKVRTLWYEAATIKTLPRLLIVDRDGYLRADCTLQFIEDEVKKLLDAKSPTTQP